MDVVHAHRDPALDALVRTCTLQDLRIEVDSLVVQELGLAEPTDVRDGARLVESVPNRLQDLRGIEAAHALRIHEEMRNGAFQIAVRAAIDRLDGHLLGGITVLIIVVVEVDDRPRTGVISGEGASYGKHAKARR